MNILNLVHNLGMSGGFHNRPRPPMPQGNLFPLPNPQQQLGPAAGHGGPGSGSAVGPHGANWGGQSFNDVNPLVAWINAHGGHTDVNQFLMNHPALQGLFGHPASESGGPRFGGIPPVQGNLVQHRRRPPMPPSGFHQVY